MLKKLVTTVLIVIFTTPQTIQGYAVGHYKYGAIDKFPYQVMLIGKQLWRSRILCGGTLLDKRWILTAGHCSIEVTHFDVYLGSMSVDAAKLSGLSRILRSSKFIVHEKFNPSTAANDIALVMLPEDISFNAHVQPAMLPFKQQQRKEQFVGAKVVATGWGEVGETKNSDTLQYTELSVITNSDCEKEYDVIQEGILCARGLKDETVCTGDSGGPLVLKGTQILIGITSFGPAEGCETNVPGGFTRVTHYLDWILKQTGDLSKQQIKTTTISQLLKAHETENIV